MFHCISVYRLFMSRQCPGCCKPISPDDMVMAVALPRSCHVIGGHLVVYHAACFRCTECGQGSRPLVPGEQYGLDENSRVYCRPHYCHLRLVLGQLPDAEDHRASSGKNSKAATKPAAQAPTGTGSGRTRGRPRKIKVPPEVLGLVSLPSVDETRLTRLMADVEDDATDRLMEGQLIAESNWTSSSLTSFYLLLPSNPLAR